MRATRDGAIARMFATAADPSKSGVSPPKSPGWSRTVMMRSTPPTFFVTSSFTVEQHEERRDLPFVDEVLARAEADVGGTRRDVRDDVGIDAGEHGQIPERLDRDHATVA